MSDAIQEIRIPDIGDAEDVVVIELCVAPGDQVEADDALIVIESDKASMEVPAGVNGVVEALLVAIDDEVVEGQAIARIERAAGEPAAPPAPATAKASAAAKAAKPQEPPSKQPQPAPAPPPTAQPAERPAAQRPSGGPVYAGPATRRLARELGVDLSEVAATGARGRIVKDDVKAYVKQRLTSGDGALPRLPTIDFSRFGETETVPLSRIRAAGAQNLHRSWLNLPHVTQHDEVDVTELEAHRAGLKAEAAERGVSLSPLPFLIKACCLALKEFPTFNASLDASGSQFILKRYYHIGVAVDTEQGLLVPVIRNADAKDVWDLAEATADLAAKARNQRLAMHELQGGSFSISSLGAIGGTGFTPIINAPEVAILGVGRLATKPVWDGGDIAPRRMLPLSLSFDHRAINGAEAGRFMAHLAGVLGNVSLLK
ncbi:MAG: 2-oxo acid dehydrogenase subunit E2 [Gammaproteobacteria bacterium]|nr:2-oxo acid dehydrogenase subunit E2 [Gammaproteobacteria bacterium]